MSFIAQEPASNTVQSSKNPFGLIIALDDNGKASGSLFWDGLDTMGAIENKEYALFDFNVQNVSEKGVLDVDRYCKFRDLVPTSSTLRSVYTVR